jgi:hypothetical protein
MPDFSRPAKMTPEMQAAVREFKGQGYWWHNCYMVPVRLDSLRTDPKYQRHLDKKKVAEMCKNFHDAAFKTVIVSRRKDRFHYRLDSQHQTEAVRDREGYEWVAAQIHFNLTQKQEAFLFKIHNTTKRIGVKDTFKAELIAGVQAAVEIQLIVIQNRLSLNLERGDHGEITSIKALVDIYKLHPDVLRETLRVIDVHFRCPDGSVQEDAVKEQFLHGLSQYLFKCEGKVTAENIDVRGFTASAIYDAADDEKENPRSDPWPQICDWFQHKTAWARRKAA